MSRLGPIVPCPASFAGSTRWHRLGDQVWLLGLGLHVFGSGLEGVGVDEHGHVGSYAFVGWEPVSENRREQVVESLDAALRAGAGVVFVAGC